MQTAIVAQQATDGTVQADHAMFVSEDQFLAALRAVTAQAKAVSPHDYEQITAGAYLVAQNQVYVRSGGSALVLEYAMQAHHYGRNTAEAITHGSAAFVLEYQPQPYRWLVTTRFCLCGYGTVEHPCRHMQAVRLYEATKHALLHGLPGEYEAAYPTLDEAYAACEAMLAAGRDAA